MKHFVKMGDICYTVREEAYTEGAESMGRAIKLTAIGMLFCVALAMAILSSHAWHWLVALALGFSWFGDAFLAHFEPLTRKVKDPFLAGMTSFALAQIVYSIAFWLSMQGMPTLHARLPGMYIGAEVVIALWPMYVLVAVLAWVWFIMRADQPRVIKIGTLIYSILLSTSAALAGSAAFTGTMVAWPLLAGGILFMISDGLIAAHEFGGRIENQKKYDFLVWATYLPAQVLLFLGSSWLY